MLAKTESAEHVTETFDRLGGTVPVLALVESALGIEEAPSIARARGAFRLGFGSGDYRRDTGTSADDLAMAREGVARIDDEGNLKADNVFRAEGVLKDRQREAETAREGFVVATKNRMKIDEHRENHLREEAAWADRRQEIELEDFTGKKVSDDRDA
jgi:citrate lyase beta subunit